MYAYWHDPAWKKFVGATVKIWDLAHNLATRQIDVILFLPRYGFAVEKVPFKIIEVPFLNLPVLRPLTFNLALAAAIAVRVRRYRPDIFYVRRMGSIVPALLARMLRIPFLYEVNDDPYRREYQKGSVLLFTLRSLASRLQEDINLKLAARVYTITPDIIASIVMRNAGLAKHKFAVLPSGANVDLFKPMDPVEARSAVGLDSGRKYIGFVGTLLKHQGVDVLIAAAAIIVKQMPNAMFVIVGEGPLKQDWMNLAVSRSLGDHFRFTGQIRYEQMPQWLNAFDVCVAPFLESAGYRSPVKIFDYMACGRPVVASDIPGTTSVFRESDAIRLIPPENPRALAGAIMDLLADPSRSDALGRAGRIFVVRNYDRKHLAEKIVSTARQLTPSKRGN